MKQLYYILFIFSFLFFLSSCLDDPEMDTRLQKASVPELGMIELGEKTATTVLVKASVKKENGAPLNKRGFKYWLKNNNSAAKDTSETENIGKGEYSILIKDLIDGKTYEITSFASNEIGIGYGDTITITTNIGVGEVKTSDVNQSTVTATTARVEGVFSKKGEGEITDFGFELYKSGVKDTVYVKSDGVDWADNDSTFYYTITDLEANTDYDVIAFAKNSFGEFDNITGKKHFKTHDGLPILADSIGSVSNYDFVLLNSKLASEGEAEIEELGFCWTKEKASNRPNIEEDDTIRSILASDGTFEGKITELETGVTYYARTFAKNKFGIVYSKDSIRISKKMDLPAISLNPSSTYIIENGSVIVSGELQDEGKSPVTSIILYYSTKKSETSPGPGTGNSEGYKEVTLDENGKTFSVSLSLLGGKPYYVRVYAKNGSGTAFSEEVPLIQIPDIFTKKADFNGDGRQDFMTFCLEDRIFVFGGKVKGEYSNTLYGYSSNSNIWTQLTSYEWNIEGGTVCTDGNSAYVIGGKSVAYITDVRSYIYNSDNPDKWVSHPEMKLRSDMVGTLNATSFAQNNSIVILGGEKILTDDDRGLVVQDTIFQWDGDQWNNVGNFPAMIKGGIAVTTGDSVIVGLGSISTDSISSDINRELWINTSGNWSNWESLTIAPSEMGKVSTGIVKDSYLYFIDHKGVIWKCDLNDNNKWYKCSKLSPSVADSPEYKIMKIGETIYILAINNFGKSSFVTYNPTWDIANEQN